MVDNKFECTELHEKIREKIFAEFLKVQASEIAKKSEKKFTKSRRTYEFGLKTRISDWEPEAWTFGTTKTEWVVLKTPLGSYFWPWRCVHYRYG